MLAKGAPTCRGQICQLIDAIGYPSFCFSHLVTVEGYFAGVESDGLSPLLGRIDTGLAQYPAQSA
jgi:hypothetical protein